MEVAVGGADVRLAVGEGVIVGVEVAACVGNCASVQVGTGLAGSHWANFPEK